MERWVSSVGAVPQTPLLPPGVAEEQQNKAYEVQVLLMHLYCCKIILTAPHFASNESKKSGRQASFTLA